MRFMVPWGLMGLVWAGGPIKLPDGSLDWGPSKSQLERGAAAQDSDKDGVHNAADNCPEPFNPDQADADGDGVGDACDLCPEEPAGTMPYGCPFVDGQSTADPAAISSLQATIAAGREAPPCDVLVTAELADPAWTRASSTSTRLVVTVQRIAAETVYLPYYAGPCPCGIPDGTGAVQAMGLPAADPRSPACEAARGAVSAACANMGACFDHSLPYVTLAPGERKTFPVSFPIDGAGVPCAYGALPRTGSLTIQPHLSVSASTRGPTTEFGFGLEAPSAVVREGARICAQPTAITLN